MMTLPRLAINPATPGPIKSPTRIPTRIVSAGVIMMSSLVLFDTSLPNSTAKIVAT